MTAVQPEDDLKERQPRQIGGGELILVKVLKQNSNPTGVPSQNVFLKGLKMSENQYVDKKKDSSIITKPHHLT